MEKMMKYDKIILMSFPVDDLRELFRSVIKEELYLSNQKKQEKELMNFKETCAYLDISASTLNNYKRDGILPFKRLQKRIFFNKGDIKKAMKDNNYKKLKNIGLNDEC